MAAVMVYMPHLSPPNLISTGPPNFTEVEELNGIQQSPSPSKHFDYPTSFKNGNDDDDDDAMNEVNRLLELPEEQLQNVSSRLVTSS